MRKLLIGFVSVVSVICWSGFVDSGSFDFVTSKSLGVSVRLAAIRVPRTDVAAIRVPRTDVAAIRVPRTDVAAIRVPRVEMYGASYLTGFQLV